MNTLTKDKLDSVFYLDFINNLDKIFYELLYSSQNGYINLSSAGAVNEFDLYIQKFDYEASKISQNVDFANKNDIISSKKEEFIRELEKHFYKEAQNWAQEVFENQVDNILFSVGLNKDNAKILDALYTRAISLIGWLCQFGNFDKSISHALVKKFNSEYKEALKSNFNDYLPNEKTQKTQPDIFLKILKIYRENFDDFMSLDFYVCKQYISQEDLNYFVKLKDKSCTSEKTLYDDEIDLINCAVGILNLKADIHKYEFIKLVLNDFNNFLSQNKKITEEDKINLTKRRIELYKDALSNHTEFKYFKKKLISLNG